MERNAKWLDILAVAGPPVVRGLLVAALTALTVTGMLPPDAARCLVGVVAPAEVLGPSASSYKP